MKRASRERKNKPWTLLVYLAGDNDLGPEMVWSLQEMSKVSRRRAIRDAMNLAVEIDAAGITPRRYELVSPAVEGWNRRDGNLAALGREAPRPGENEIPVERFLSDVIDDFPGTTHYAVILSGHGSGALGDFLPDLEPESALSVPGLGGVLERARRRLERKTEREAKIAILGLDSCQMGTVETAYELRDVARHLVASEGTVLNAGWPYHRVLDAFARTRSVEGAARAIVRDYRRFYRDYELAGQSTDIAVCDLSRIDDVAAALRELSEAIRAPLSRLLPDGLEEGIEMGAFERTAEASGVQSAREIRDAIVLAHWSAQSYKRDRYLDLADFCGQLARYCRRRGGAEGAHVVERCERVARAVARAVIAAGTTGPEFQHSRGLSVYFPWSSDDYDTAYRGLELAERSRWADFLETYHETTRRMRRGQENRLADGPPLAPNAPDGLRPRATAAGEAGDTKDPDAGTHRDPDAGTHRGADCASTTRNPPRGFYDSSK